MWNWKRAENPPLTRVPARRRTGRSAKRYWKWKRMENRFEHTPPEEQQGWGAYATPPPYPDQQNSYHSELPQGMNLCARVRDMLPSLLENDGEIRPEMAAALYGHLAVCPGCAREFEEMQRVVAVLEALPPAEMP